MVESSITSDVELLRLAWEECAEPLTRDIVLTREVADYVCRHSLAKPSVVRIDRMLCRPPFTGISKPFKAGNGSYRAIILRNHLRWSNAAGADLMSCISGENISVDISK